MKLLLDSHVRQLAANGVRFDATGEDDFVPVVKLFTPDANATWLLVLSYPDAPDILFGLCDLGLGFPELGTVRLSELVDLRGPLGLAVERDRHFDPDGRTLSVYAADALKRGHIAA